MGDIVNKSIKVKSIYQEPTPFGATKTIIKVEGTNGKDVQLYFLSTKKDKTKTRAQQDFDTMKVGLGTDLVVGVVSEPFEFVSKRPDTAGKTVKGTKYRIISMQYAAGPGVNTTKTPQQVAHDDAEAFRQSMGGSEQAAPEYDEEISVEDIPF